MHAESHARNNYDCLALNTALRKKDRRSPGIPGPTRPFFYTGQKYFRDSAKACSSTGFLNTSPPAIQIVEAKSFDRISV